MFFFILYANNTKPKKLDILSLLLNSELFIIYMGAISEGKWKGTNSADHHYKQILP